MVGCAQHLRACKPLELAALLPGIHPTDRLARGSRGRVTLERTYDFMDEYQKNRKRLRR